MLIITDDKGKVIAKIKDDEFGKGKPLTLNLYSSDKKTYQFDSKVLVWTQNKNRLVLS